MRIELIVERTISNKTLQTNGILFISLVSLTLTGLVKPLVTNANK
jgi:hypothetical protein